MPSDPIQHLRDLLANVPSGTWRVDKRGLPAVYAYAPDDKNDIPSVLMYQGDARVHKAQLIVAAINALPALLAVAEAARKLPDFVTTDEESKARALARVNQMLSGTRAALAKLDEVKP